MPAKTLKCVLPGEKFHEPTVSKKLLDAAGVVIPKSLLLWEAYNTKNSLNLLHQYHRQWFSTTYKGLAHCLFLFSHALPSFLLLSFHVLAVPSSLSFTPSFDASLFNHMQILGTMLVQERKNFDRLVSLRYV